ncbi:MAG: SAM-dependent methyltransferase, partial [Rhodospirillaceae bacterium]|nr:SAM-dependent methyltransferase [Rhodospirillaceae bacterium]
MTVIDANGRRHRFKGQRDGSEVTIRLHARALHWKLFINPMLHTGEAVADGTPTVEDGDLYDFLDLIALNIGWRQPDHWLQRFIITPLRET